MIEVPENHNDIKVGLLLESKFAHPSVMLRKKTLVEHQIFYDNSVEPVEDYDLWVRLSCIGELHNLQECLLEYRVHDAQVSNVNKEKQLKLSKDTRLKLLLFLNSEVFSNPKKEVYLKSIGVYEKMSFEEFLMLLDLKKELVECNSVKAFFDEKGFYSYWSYVESKFNGYYFKNRISYSLKILQQYVTIYDQLSNKLLGKDLIKLIIKSFLNYQVK